MEGRLSVCIVTIINIFFVALSEPKLTYAKTKATKPLVSAAYIFGDSTVDAGNNNELATIAKANFPPYGRDFVDSIPTGRFTDGRLATDVVCNYCFLCSPFFSNYLYRNKICPYLQLI